MNNNNNNGKGQKDNRRKSDSDTKSKNADKDVETPATVPEDERDWRAFIVRQNELMRQHVTDSIAASEKNIKKIIDSKFNELHALVTDNSKRIIKIDEKANEAHSTAKVNQHDLELQGEAITRLENANEKLVAEIKQLHLDKDVEAIRYNTLRNRIEDQTNRACRKTLIVKGIKEQSNEEWADTERLLKERLSKICKLNECPDFSIDKAIERAHRGKLWRNGENAGKRDIHVALYDWKDVNFLMGRFIKHGRRQGVFIDQRYGPDTTYRRNMAKKERKTLMATKEFKSSHVKYPATLVVKSHEKGAKYKVYKNFSSIDVPDYVPDDDSG
jgi:hypothetical protein